MPQKRLTFTVKENTYRAIAEHLDADESVDDWVRDAIAERLSEDDRDPDDHDPDYRQPLEFVDDCAI